MKKVNWLKDRLREEPTERNQIQRDRLMAFHYMLTVHNTASLSTESLKHSIEELETLQDNLKQNGVGANLIADLETQIDLLKEIKDSVRDLLDDNNI